MKKSLISALFARTAPPRDAARTAPKFSALRAEPLESREMLSATETVLFACPSDQDCVLWQNYPDPSAIDLSALELSSSNAVSSNTWVVSSTDDDASVAGTLRYALANAANGDTITFADSLAGETITLSSELTTNKTLTIDASNLWNSVTSEPGLTLSGGRATRILKLNQGADVEIKGITFSNGHVWVDNDIWTDSCGGAIFNDGMTLLLDNCVINNCFAATGGGGVYSNFSDTTLTNCTVTNNEAAEGGGIYSSYLSETTLVNCTVSDNSGWNGGGIYSYDETTLVNCTVTGNEGVHGGGIYMNYSELNAYNSIIAGNWDNDDVYIYERDSDSVANAYSTLSSFTDWASSANNLIYDASKPLFTDAANGDYTLAENSQAINKGDNQYVTTETDLAGNARIYGGTVDLGAYESQVASEPVQLDAPVVSVTATTTETITVAWDAVANVKRYSVSYKLASGTTWTNVNVGTNTSYTITDLTPDTEYDIRVKAVGDEVNYKSAYSALVHAKTDATQPVGPVDLEKPIVTVSDKTDTTITVSWDAVANAKRYSVSYKLASGTTWTNVNVRTNTSYTITGLAADAEYDIRVKAVGDEVNYKSAYSAIVQGKTDASTPVGPVNLEKPVVTVSGKTDTTITISWNAVDHADRYSVSYKPTGESTWTNKNAGTNTAYTITGLTPDTKYDIRVKAIGDGVNYKSVYSTIIQGKTDTAQPVGPIVIEKPVLTVAGKSDTTITVSWNAVDHADRYSVSYKPTGETTWTNKNVGTNTSYTISGLTPNTEYDIRVKAVGDGVNYKSVYSAIIQSKTDETQPVGPIPLTKPVVSVAGQTGKAITVSWDAVENAERYSLSYRLASESTWTNVNVGTKTSYTIGGLEKNSEYDVRLKAVGDGENYKSVYSDVVPAATDDSITPLDTPVVTVADVTEETVTVSWDAVPYAERYSLFYRYAGDSSWTNVNVGKDTSYTITELDWDCEFDVRLKAVGDGVDYKSAYSAIIHAHTDEETEVFPWGNPRVTAKTTTSITIEWDPVPRTTGYRIYWGVEGSSSNVVTLRASQTTYTFNGLDNGTTYGWRLHPIFAPGVITPAIVNPIQYGKPQQTLATPDASAATTTTSVTLSWDAIPHAARYVVSYRPATETNWSNELDAGTNSSYTINGLAQNTLYHVRVKALGDGLDYGDSSYSAVIRAKTTSASSAALDLGDDLFDELDEEDFDLLAANWRQF